MQSLESASDMTRRQLRYVQQTVTLMEERLSSVGIEGIEYMIVHEGNAKERCHRLFV
jgi:hypothetical protein